MPEREQERPFTWNDLAAMSADNLRREIMGGVLEEVAAPGATRRAQVLRFARRVEDAAGPLGTTFGSPIDLRLSTFDVVQPDVLFARGELADVREDDRIARVPDLVAEVISPGAALTDRVRKVALSARSGVREYWIIDPRNRTVTARVLDDGGYAAAAPGADGLLVSRVIPGLTVGAESLFDGIPGPS